MTRVPVTSSNIVSIGYDEASKTLEVEFKDGVVYQYLDVEADKHANLMNADSHGKFLNAQIKGQYRYQRL